jgi:hypothetical protein
MAETYKHLDDAKHGELDRALDAALAKYAVVEPRAGLEDRVLANLRAERAWVPDRAWWRWSAAAALAAVVVVAVALALRSGRPSHPVAANHSSAATRTAMESVTHVVSNSGGNRMSGNQVHPPDHAAKLSAAMHRSQPKVLATDPKLDQFPSPRPLSEQEKILESYVANYPEHAALIARARAEELRRDAAEEMGSGGTGSEKGSQQ